MHIEYLQYLLDVAESGSISSAAKKLYISPTGLTDIINSVEAGLNIRIFKRTHRGVILTEEGKKAIPLIETILETNKELHRLTQEYVDEKAALNIAVFPSAVKCLSIELASRLRDEYPNCALHVYEEPYNRGFNCVHENISNIAVIAENPSNIDIDYEMKTQGVFIEPLMNDSFFAIVPSSSAYAKRESVSLEELLGETLAVTQVFPTYKDKTVSYVFRRFPSYIIFSNNAVVKQAVASGQCISFMPGSSMVDEPLHENGLIQPVTVTGFDTDLTHYLIHKQGAKLSRQERWALEIVRDYYREVLDPRIHGKH